MLAELSPGLGGLDGLEERSEDGGADARPVEGARAHEFLSHLEREAGDAERLREDPAVHVGETGNQLVQGRLTALYGCVQGLVEERELCAEVAAVLTGPGVEKIGEQVAVPQARVITVETKEGADEEDRGLVVAVARPVQGLVEVGHDAGGPNRGLLLLARTNPNHAVSGEELQVVDMIGELRKHELDVSRVLTVVVMSSGVPVEVDDTDSPKVADDEKAWDFGIRKVVDVIESLLLRPVEVLPRGLHLDERLARYESINVAVASS